MFYDVGLRCTAGLCCLSVLLLCSIRHFTISGCYLAEYMRISVEILSRLGLCWVAFLSIVLFSVDSRCLHVCLFVCLTVVHLTYLSYLFSIGFFGNVSDLGNAKKKRNVVLHHGRKGKTPGSSRNIHGCKEIFHALI